MHKLIDFICEEMEQLEQKVGKEHNLSMQDIQLLDTLAHTKKNLLKAMEMEEMEYSERSYRGGGSSRGSYRGSYDGGSYEGSSRSSYARGRSERRDSMGRYASDGYSRSEESDRGHNRMMQRLQEIMHDTPDERERRKLDELISEYGGM